MCDHVNKQFKNYIVKTTISDNTPSIIFIFDFDNEHVLVKAEYGNPPITTLNEISWYNKINYKPVSLFITSVYNNNIAAIFLKYKLKADTIDNLVEKKKLNSEQICITFYKNEKLLKKLFYNNDTHKVDFADRDRHYSLKYKNRMGSQFITQRLKECLNIDPIIINDKVYRPINECIGHIINQRKLHDYLTPTHHGIIHGDLHFGNVLLEKDKYYWVDPNGDMQMPIEYDYGKMFHSIHGGYGRIIKNGVFLETNFKASVRILCGYAN